MLPTLIRTLEPLASSQALRLVVGLYLSGALLLACPDDRFLVPFFLLQRGLVIVLLWPNLGLYLVAASAAASVAAGLIYLFTAWCLYHRAGAAVARSTWGALPLTYLPLRALAAALAVLLTYTLLQRYPVPLLPPLLTWAVVWLLVQFCFALLLAPNSLHTGLGVLAFADAARILYALTRPDALVWGLWAACDVLVALAAAHLRVVEVAAYAGGALPRRERRPRRGLRGIFSRPAPAPATAPAEPAEAVPTPDLGADAPVPSALSAPEAAAWTHAETMELSADHDGTPALAETDQHAPSHEEPPHSSALSALETKASTGAEPEPGETP